MNSLHDNPEWQAMYRKSFVPRQWFDRDDDEEHGNGDNDHSNGGGGLDPETMDEGFGMWVYRNQSGDQASSTRRSDGSYAVGYYSPDGTWNEDSVYNDRRAAADRVHYLNGGGKHS